MQGTPDLDDPVAIAPQTEPWGKFVSLNGNKVRSQDLHEIEVNLNPYIDINWKKSNKYNLNT